MEKEPLKSVLMSTGTRVYYFDVYKDNQNTDYLVISEIPTDNNPGNKERRKLFVHSQNIERFAEALREVAEFIEKDMPR